MKNIGPKKELLQHAGLDTTEVDHALPQQWRDDIA